MRRSTGALRRLELKPTVPGPITARGRGHFYCSVNGAFPWQPYSRSIIPPFWTSRGRKVQLGPLEPPHPSSPPPTAHHQHRLSDLFQPQRTFTSSWQLAVLKCRYMRNPQRLVPRSSSALVQTEISTDHKVMSSYLREQEGKKARGFWSNHIRPGVQESTSAFFKHLQG